MSTEFKNIKQEYVQNREIERKELAKYLSTNTAITERGLEVKKGNSGKGRTTYRSGGRIAAYDLSNWKWVELNGQGTDARFTCIVLLNMVEQDPNTANVHCLYDRIGIKISYKIGEFYYATDIYTNIDLPLTEIDKKRIAEIAVKQFEVFHELKEECVL